MRRIAGEAGRRAGLLVGIGALVLATLAMPALSAQRAGEAASKRPEAVTAARKPQGPLQIIISIDRQTLRLFDKDGLVEQSTVSTGTGGFPTPTGVFSVIDKEKDHYSNIYRGASMPNMQRLTMSGVALHSGIVTGRPASHGCIRLPHAYSIRLFGLTRLGTRVIIADDEVSPAAIEHPRLFKPKRPQVATIETASLPGMPKGETSLVAVAGSLAAQLQREVARAVIGPGTAEREAALQSLAVSVFVSRAAGRVFVRHGFLPLFDAPAEIRDGERPLGTHVYTAMEAVDDGARMHWTAVSFPKRAGASGASEALDRIELPADVAERISAMLTPGASLIVSDEGPSRQMRPWGTDFIILTE
jgi:L,D-transpeptidase catalytic domain